MRTSQQREHEVQIAETLGDPAAPFLRALLDLMRMLESRTWISQDDIDRVCHEASAATQSHIARLVKIEQGRSWWRLPVALVAGFVVGGGLVYVTCGLPFGGFSLAAPPICKDGICWMAVRIEP